MTPWVLPPDLDVNDWFGFIYRVTNQITGQQYIGKKQFWFTTRVKVPNRKNRKHVKKESDWRTYTGSSVHLNNDIASIGITHFTFEILSLHRSKGSLHYAEVERQVMEDVLRAKLPCGQTRKYYNRQISAVKFIPPLDK